MVGGTGGLKVTIAVPNLVLSVTLVAVTVTVCELPIDAGAVYSPALVIVPAFVVGVMLQVTAVLLVPATEALNGCCCPANKVIAAGVTVREMGANEMMAVADLVLSTVLVAVSVIVWATEIGLGAVYRPPGVIVPTAGDRLQLTLLLLRPATATVNCCCRPAESVVTGGVIPIETYVKSKGPYMWLADPEITVYVGGLVPKTAPTRVESTEVCAVVAPES